MNVNIYLESGDVLSAKTNSKEDFVTFGELVFTTAMTGYQEIVTDPSFAGQIIIMTYPLIGNYGFNESWSQSDKVYAKGVIVQNIDIENGYENFLLEKETPLIHSLDTRYLVQLTRVLLYPKCVISTKELSSATLSKYYQMINPNIVHEISTKTPILVGGRVRNNKKIGVFDFGLKRGIVEELKNYFSEVIILPYNFSSDSISCLELDSVLLSNGPGNPDILYTVIDNIRDLLGKVDIYGICLGHQLLALALGCETCVMGFGHRGANHPVINVQTGKVIITSQNHSYEVVEETMPKDIMVTYRNIHDNSIEGIKSMKYNAESVQFHPEASPGPNDAKIVFQNWFG